MRRRGVLVLKKARMDFAVSIGLIMLGIAMLIGVRDVVPLKGLIDVGSGFFPSVFGWLLIILCSINSLVNLRILLKKKQYSKTSVDYGKGMRADSEASKMTFREFCRKYADWISVILIFVYVLSFKPLGFVLSSALYLMLQISALGMWDKKSLLTYFIISLVAPTITYVVFRVWFSVMLPVGIAEFLRF